MNQGVLVKRIRQALKQENLSETKIENVVDRFLGQTQITAIPKAVFEKAFKNAFTRLNKTNRPIILMRTKTNKVRVFSQDGLAALRESGQRRIPHLKPFVKKTQRRIWTTDETTEFMVLYRDFQNKTITRNELLDRFPGRSAQQLYVKAYVLGITNKRS